MIKVIDTAAGKRIANLLLGMAAAAMLAGCVSQTVKRVNPEPAQHAEQEIPSEQLLNVNISVFDPGIPPDLAQQENPAVFPEVRKAEARALPVKLRETLQNTGHWGAVRVVPESIEYSELLVTGEIRHSDGELLKLAIQARDASGRLWLDRIYDQQAAKLSYSERAIAGNDPFQGIYNQIANDLLEVRREMAAADIRNIRRLSELRFAARLAPDAFDPYLRQEGGRYRLAGLPAQGDPMLARIEKIRERDNLLIDSLDQHYRIFDQQIKPSYNEWRSASYREVVNLRELRQAALTRKILGALAVIGGIIGAGTAESGTGVAASQVAIIGGAYVFQSGLQKGRETQIHAEALQELGQSLSSDVEPRVVELEGETVTLSGSAEAQYEEWQKLLKAIYAAETGLATGIQDSRQGSAGNDL